MTAGSHRRIVDEIAPLRSEWTGCSDDAIRRDAAEDVMRSTLEPGTTIEQLRDRAAPRELAMVGAAARAYCNGPRPERNR
ncbi:MAG: hypothetical protein M3O36_14140 [Myxococcota bacterium]|nr:hypothetical protein [Myxococcota bacterium]